MTDERTPEARLLELAEKAAHDFEHPLSDEFIDDDTPCAGCGVHWIDHEESHNLACDPDTISKLCRVVEAARKVWNEAIDHRYSDEFIGQRFRSVVGNALIDMDDTP